MRPRLLLLGALAVAALVLAAFLLLRPAARGPIDAAPDARASEARAARLRACGLPADASLHEPESVPGECQKVVLRAIDASAGDAVFPGMFDDDGTPTSPLGCDVVYRSWVEARDPSGVEVRRAYTCTFDPRIGVARVELE